MLSIFKVLVILIHYDSQLLFLITLIISYYFSFEIQLRLHVIFNLFVYEDFLITFL